jgi:hypothetical protein
METFRDYALNEFLLQAWSLGQRWKRPDLLLIPRALLQEQAGNDQWTPDLIHWDNERCEDYVSSATAAVEVETSLWQVSRATVPLSFTVKDEDLAALRTWVNATSLPLYVFQVFYDQAYVLPFSTLEHLIRPSASTDRKIVAEVDRFTRKATYKVPLSEGLKVGDIPEPDVEGRVYKARNGRVTVYGRLTGSRIETDDRGILGLIASGTLTEQE